jgi:hypothetical protein
MLPCWFSLTACKRVLSHQLDVITTAQYAGVERELYKYYKAETCGLDFEGMIADLEVLVWR